MIAKIDSHGLRINAQAGEMGLSASFTKPLIPAACCDADHTKINSFRALAQVLLIDCGQVIDTDLTH